MRHRRNDASFLALSRQVASLSPDEGGEPFYDEELGDFIYPGEEVFVIYAPRHNPMVSASDPDDDIVDEEFLDLESIKRVVRRALRFGGFRGPVDVDFSRGGWSTCLGFCGYKREGFQLKVRLRFNKIVWPTLPASERLDTILHEVAHAIHYQNHKKGEKPHGPEWQAFARSLGAKPSARLDKKYIPILREGRVFYEAKKRETEKALAKARAVKVWNKIQVGAVVRALDERKNRYIGVIIDMNENEAMLSIHAPKNYRGPEQSYLWFPLSSLSKSMGVAKDLFWFLRGRHKRGEIEVCLWAQEDGSVDCDYGDKVVDLDDYRDLSNVDNADLVKTDENGVQRGKTIEVILYDGEGNRVDERYVKISDDGKIFSIK